MAGVTSIKKARFAGSRPARNYIRFYKALRRRSVLGDGTVGTGDLSLRFSAAQHRTARKRREGIFCEVSENDDKRRRDRSEVTEVTQSGQGEEDRRDHLGSQLVTKRIKNQINQSNQPITSGTSCYQPNIIFPQLTTFSTSHPTSFLTSPFFISSAQISANPPNLPPKPIPILYQETHKKSSRPTNGYNGAKKKNGWRRNKISPVLVGPLTLRVPRLPLGAQPRQVGLVQPGLSLLYVLLSLIHI